MSYIVVDIEGDGPIIGKHSMVSFGAVLIDKEHKLDTTFYSTVLKPLNWGEDDYDPEALAVSGISREEQLKGSNPAPIMYSFNDWIKDNTKGRAILISDNNGYDAAWMNWYFHTYVGENPFGWSSRRIGDMFAGYMNDPYYQWKKHRKSPHNHDPVSDAKGNAEALIWLQKQGYKIKFK